MVNSKNRLIPIFNEYLAEGDLSRNLIYHHLNLQTDARDGAVHGVVAVPCRPFHMHCPYNGGTAVQKLPC